MRTSRCLPALAALAAAAALVTACSGPPSKSAGTPPAGQPGSQATGATGTGGVLASTSTVAAGGTGTVSAQGVGTVEGKPDSLTVDITVSTTAAHASSAMATDNTLTAAVQKALEGDGVAATDLQTADLSLQQNWGTKGPQGYVASDEVAATLHDLSDAGKVIDDALAPAGDSGRLNGVTFSFSDTGPLMSSARQQAVRSAKAQAEQMATAAGGRLGTLVSITDVPDENGESTSEGEQYSSASGSASAPASVPVQAGEQQLTVDVVGVWQVVPGK